MDEWINLELQCKRLGISAQDVTASLVRDLTYRAVCINRRISENNNNEGIEDLVRTSAYLGSAINLLVGGWDAETH